MQDATLTARIVSSQDLPGVGAGSGLAWMGGRLVAIQDDAPIAALIDPATAAVELVPLLPDAARMAKMEKPDLEAIAPAPDGSLWLLGSGSAPRRRQVARLADGVATWHDVGALYDAVAAAIGEEPNIEGAAVQGDGMRLFHRGAGRGTCRNWVLDVALGAEGPSLPLGAAFEIDVGLVGDVPLSITDASALPDGRYLYLAAAEDTPDAVADGPVVGAAIGLLSGSATRWTLLLEPDGTPSVRKVEGLAPDADLAGAWLITDPDDPGIPAQLLRVALEGPWR